MNIDQTARCATCNQREPRDGWQGALPDGWDGQKWTEEGA